MILPIALAAGLAIMSPLVTSGPSERYTVYDEKSRRTDTIIRKGDRVDVYGPKWNRTEYGKINRDGSVDLYDAKTSKRTRTIRTR